MVKLVVLLGLFLSTVSSAKIKNGVLSINQDRTIAVVGPIKDLEPQAKTVLDLSKRNKKPIFIILNTPGGSVAGGLILIRAINRAKAKGVAVNCIVTDMSMSMGMHIMAACNNNYAFDTSLLMHHDVAFYSMFYKHTSEVSKANNKQLDLLGNYLDRVLRKRLGVKKHKFREYSKNEYIQYAITFNKYAPNFLVIIKDFTLQ